MRSAAPVRLVRKVFFKTPSLIPVIASGLFHKHVRTDFDYWASTGRASAPPCMITLRITNACNHRCAVCGQYGQHGYLKTDSGLSRSKVLPVERYLELVDEVAQYKPALNITGGEPFLYPDLLRLCNYAKKRGLTVLVTTNGVKLQELANEIVENQWDVVLVSLDGPEKIHDRCRNLEGAFRTACKGLEELRKCKMKHRTTKPYINTSTTLSTTNVKYLEETFEIGKRLEPDLMVVFLSWFTSETIGRQQSAILRHELGIEPQTWKSYVRSFTAEQADEFQQALVELKKRPRSFDYFIVPDVGDDNYAKYYLEPSNFFGYSKCAAPFLMTDILPNGDVVTCRDYVDVKVGNLQDHSLLEIWNGQRYVEYRQMMIRHKGLLPQCSRCCGLMGF